MKTLKEFFLENSKLSMGRLLALLLFVIVSFAFLFKVITNNAITIVMRDLILGGWSVAIIGKGLQKFAEKIKK